VLGTSVVSLEVALAKLRAMHADSATISVHAPGQAGAARTIPVKFFGPDSARIAGTIGARVDGNGRLIAMRRGPQEVQRVPSLDIARAVASFTAADEPRRAAEAAAAASRVEVTLPPSALQRFVGEYALNADVALAVRLDGDRLMILISGQPPVQLFAQSASSFFLKAAGNQQVEFETDASGNATALVLVAGGARQRAVKK
jgi:hypothetical protein